MTIEIKTSTEAKTVCSDCGHDKLLHDMKMEKGNKQCLQPHCTCWNFTNAQPEILEEEGLAREGESTKQETHQQSSNNNIQPSQSQQQQPVRDDLDIEIRKIREESRTHFTKCKELVKRLGNAIKNAGIVKESDICHEVKNVLAEEIAAQDITVRNY